MTDEVARGRHVALMRLANVQDFQNPSKDMDSCKQQDQVGDHQ
jgi:hypothetical protein